MPEEACPHTAFESAVHVEAAPSSPGSPPPVPGLYRADLTIRCAACQEMLRFEFAPTVEVVPQPVSAYAGGTVVRLHGRLAPAIAAPAPTWQPASSPAPTPG